MKDFKLNLNYEYPKTNIDDYLPVGKAYYKYKEEGSIAWKRKMWAVEMLTLLAKDIVDVFKGCFVGESNHFADEWKKDYSIPDLIYSKNDDLNFRDVFVKKYLARGNTEWHFRAIANIYGMDCLIRTGDEYINEFGSLPTTHYKNISPYRLVVVSIFGGGEPHFPLEFPFVFGSEDYIKRLTDIYQSMMRLGSYVIVHDVQAKTENGVVVFDDDYDLAKSKRINLGGDMNFWSLVAEEPTENN